MASESYSSEDFATSKRTGSDDMNGYVCIIISSGFGSGRGFTVEFSRQELVAKAASLSFSFRLPLGAKSFLAGSLGEDQNR